MIESIAITVAAVGFLAWPAIKAAPAVIGGLIRRKTNSPKSLTYQASVSALADVRCRLLQTECLKDAQKGAINTLTLALVDGSDQP